MHAELEAVEVLLSRALLADDPGRELRAAIADPSTPAGVRAQLEAIDEDGLRIAGLLVTKLRFERLMNGSQRAALWFETDPRGFTDAFRAYHAAVAPTEMFPSFEARHFDAWLATR
jgi:hypothetical protein